MSKLFTGIATALTTSMFEDGSLDIASYEKLIQFQIDKKVNALVVAGTTGEGSTLTINEKLTLLQSALKIRADKKDCPIILGTGSNNTATTIEHTRLAKENGADAVLLVTPYYNKTSQQGLIEHYKAIANEVDIPIILYNVPSRTGMTIQPETIAKLAKIKNIVALKDATGDMNYLENVKRLLGDNSDFAIYSGDDSSFLNFLVNGGDGVISVVTNCLPTSFIRIYNLLNEGNIKDARRLQHGLNPFIRSLFADVSPSPIKAVLKELGYGGEYFRLPLVATSDEIRNQAIELYYNTKKL